MVLANPAHSIYVPTNDQGKFRTSEMYIACINKNNHGVHASDEEIEAADALYDAITIEQMKEILKTKEFVQVIDKEKYKPSVQISDIPKMLEILSTRTIKI